MDEQKLGLFNGEEKPNVETVWSFYQRGLLFNNQINLDDTVKVNSNFVVGKQWEGVQANGLPTPQFNILKRVVGFIVASITTDNIKVQASPLANSFRTDEFVEPVRILNEELEALSEHNRIPALARGFAYDSAVDGDGCIYTYWDPDVEVGDGVEGAIKSEIIENTRCLFGNPSDRSVQSQPYIQIASREIVRNTKIRARDNGCEGWQNIKPDSDESDYTDAVKYTDDKVTVILTLWRDDETGEIWAYESTSNAEVKKPYSLGIKLYPICWLPWDAVKDSYHGQAMVTGLIPNQIFINKAWAMSMLSMMRTAWPKVLYNRNLVPRWDNRVGGAIPTNGNPADVAKILDPASISPQVYQFIELAVDQTEQSLGATAVALGDTRPDNTSAILALQKAASTPSEMTKQRLYEAIEDLFRIYVEFIGEYYGVRKVDMPVPPEVMQQYAMIGQELPDTMPQPFDYSIFKKFPMLLKMDVGASTYYSEIASMQTLDLLLQGGMINRVQYLERIPDSYIPGRMALVNEIKQEEAQTSALAVMQQQIEGAQQTLLQIAQQLDPTGQLVKQIEAQLQGGMPVEEAPPEEPQPEPEATEGPVLAQLSQEPEIHGGRGYGAAQRAINAGLM